jgi:hypothetical protein
MEISHVPANIEGTGTEGRCFQKNFGLASGRCGNNRSVPRLFEIVREKQCLSPRYAADRIDTLMIIVHDIFVCKPGNASKLAKLFKEWADTQKQTYVMTDVTGQWHRVIVASTHDSLAAYEENFKKMMADSPENRAMNEKFKDVNDMYVSGSREIYKVW